MLSLLQTRCSWYAHLTRQNLALVLVGIDNLSIRVSPFHHSGFGFSIAERVVRVPYALSGLYPGMRSIFLLPNCFTAPKARLHRAAQQPNFTGRKADFPVPHKNICI